MNPEKANKNREDWIGVELNTAEREFAINTPNRPDNRSILLHELVSAQGGMILELFGTESVERKVEQSVTEAPFVWNRTGMNQRTFQLATSAWSGKE